MSQKIDKLNMKIKFFAQYWGQKVFYNSEKQIYAHRCIYGNRVLSSDFLKLKRLQDITDDDITEIANILNYKNWHTFQTIDLSEREDMKKIEVLFEDKDGDSCAGKLCIYTSGEIIWEYEFVHEFTDYELRILQAYDYLRSNGYLLPWCGLSIDELLKNGWVKFKLENDE